MQETQGSARQPAQQDEHVSYNRGVAELMNYLRGDPKQIR
jgi:hypothetical protein